jgi:hypothetical protein
MLTILRTSLIVGLLAYSLACKVRGDNVQENDFSRNQQPTPLYPVTINGKHGFIDQAGNLKITLSDHVYTIRQFSEGLAVIAKRVPNTYGRWGFIDEAGNVVIEARFNNAKPFSEGLAAVIIREKEDSGDKVGYIDKTGRIVIQPQFYIGGGESDFSFSQGLAAVPAQNGKWGYINKAGKFVIAPQFAHAFPFSEGRAMVGVAEPDYSIDYKWGYIDTGGRWITKPSFNSAGKFSEGFAAILDGEKVGYVDTRGEIVIKPQFDADSQCPNTIGRVTAGRFSEGLAAVQVRRKWGFIDHAGRSVIKPSYDCVEPFSEGLAVIGVRQDGRWRFGYIDKTGAIIIEPQFAVAHGFSGNLALVGVGMTDEEAALKAMEDYKAGKPENDIQKEVESKKMKLGYIDRSGKFIWQPTN